MAWFSDHGLPGAKLGAWLGVFGRSCWPSDAQGLVGCVSGFIEPSEALE